MDGGDRLYDLLMAIFRTDEELRRFLVLEQILPTENARSSTKTRSRANTAFLTVELLLRRDLVNHRLFDALLRRNPERAADIQAVADFYLGSSGDESTVTDLPPEEDVPAEFADFAAQLDAEFAAVDMAAFDPLTIAMDGSHWPWTAAVSVLGSFQPADVRPLTGYATESSASDALADLTFTSHSGRWVLEDAIRIECLKILDQRQLLSSALQSNANLDDARRDLLRDLRGDFYTGYFASMTSAELNDVDAVTGWLEAAGIESPIKRADVEAAVERRWLIDPLRTLVGTNFTGRQFELDQIRSCIYGSDDLKTLSVRGPGGAGKSTLLGKVLLDLEDHRMYDPVAFAYVDFDKARHDPRDASALIGQIARQLRLVYAASADIAAGFAAAESLSYDTDLDVAAELLEVPTDLDAAALTKVLAERLIEVDKQADTVWPPLILVLDTCEEVLARGPGAVHDRSR